jgi:hypothetical protein
LDVEREETRDHDGVYLESGENPEHESSFSLEEIATAFGVSLSRVEDAVRGEYGQGADARIDSPMAQHLSEVLLGDQPMDRREAALLKLGAFTPRSDATEGLGQNPPREESDRLSARADIPADRLASGRSSHDTSTTPSK